jgi:AcrR family transcriptional regulator
VINTTEDFVCWQVVLLVTEQSVRPMETHTSARMNVAKVSTPHGRARKLQRREKILAAAFEEFAAKGYTEARLDDVAERAGIAKGTIYLYFKNKGVLFQSVLRSLIRHVCEDFERFVRTFSGSAEELVCSALSRQYTELVKNPKARAMFRLLIAESHKFPQLSDIYLREVITPGLAAMRALVERGVASGEFRQTRITEFPQILAAPAVLAVVWTLLLGERHGFDFDAYREAHLDFVLRGLRGINSTNPPKDTESLRVGEAP